MSLTAKPRGLRRVCDRVEGSSSSELNDSGDQAADRQQLEQETIPESSTSRDLVLAVRGQKNGGGGRGRERRKRDLAKYVCVGQNLAHASTVHALNLTGFHVYSTDIELDTALRFALKNAVP